MLVQAKNKGTQGVGKGRGERDGGGGRMTAVSSTQQQRNTVTYGAIRILEVNLQVVHSFEDGHH